MKRTAILLILLALLLVAGVALAQGGTAGRYAVEPATSSGGGYRLSGLAWQFSGTASGGRYRLLGPVRPLLRGSGCCCTWTPRLLRNR